MSENPIQLFIATFDNEFQAKQALKPPEAHDAPEPADGEASA